jgi:putative transposase
MPKSPILELPPEAHGQMLAALRRARYGYLLGLHILRWCAVGRNPTEIADVLFCARSSVYRTVRAYRAGTLGLEPDVDGQLGPPLRTTVLVPSVRRLLGALLKAPPRAYGWCRTRWSCATLALTRQTKRGLTVSAETMRRWGHEVGWVWKRATLVAKDDDPHRVSRLPYLRYRFEQLRRCAALVFADELDIPLLPKVGCAWMPQGTQVEVMTPGQNEKHYLAGALDPTAGALHYALGPRKTNAVFRDLLTLLDARESADHYTRLSVVVDNYKIHKAKAVEQWLAAHPRVSLLCLPTDCPRANPIERADGDVHDCCTRNHQRKRRPDLVADVKAHLPLNGPRKDKLSDLYDEPAGTAAMEKIAAEEDVKVAA